MSAPDYKYLIDAAPKYIGQALKNDPELRRGFKDNIAMAFKDGVAQYRRKTGKKSLSAEDFHVIANESAEHFLSLLCNEIKYPAGR